MVKLIPKIYETNFLLAFGLEDFHKILYKRRYHTFFTTGKTKKYDRIFSLRSILFGSPPIQTVLLKMIAKER